MKYYYVFWNWALLLSTHNQVNPSLITKITSWFKFFGKNVYLVGCATLCAKSEVMLVILYVAWILVSKPPTLFCFLYKSWSILCCLNFFFCITIRDKNTSCQNLSALTKVSMELNHIWLWWTPLFVSFSYNRVRRFFSGK